MKQQQQIVAAAAAAVSVACLRPRDHFAGEYAVGIVTSEPFLCFPFHFWQARLRHLFFASHR